MISPELIEKFKLVLKTNQIGQAFINDCGIYVSAMQSLYGMEIMDCDISGKPIKGMITFVSYYTLEKQKFWRSIRVSIEMMEVEPAEFIADLVRSELSYHA